MKEPYFKVNEDVFICHPEIQTVEVKIRSPPVLITKGEYITCGSKSGYASVTGYCYDISPNPLAGDHVWWEGYLRKKYPPWGVFESLKEQLKSPVKEIV